MPQKNFLLGHFYYIHFQRFFLKFYVINSFLIALKKVEFTSLVQGKLKIYKKVLQSNFRLSLIVSLYN